MKTVLITGASRGIGRALAEKFLANGDRVIGTSTSGKADIVHDNFVCIRLDLGKTDSIQECIQQLRETRLPVDILINNAGIFHAEDLVSEIDIRVLRETFEVNVFGIIDFTERALSLLASGAHLINVSSRRGSLAYQDTESKYPSYTLSKTVLNMFTRLLAIRLKGSVTVSAVHPGNSVRTDMNEGQGETSIEDAATNIFTLACSNVETGQFWFRGEKFPW